MKRRTMLALTCLIAGSGTAFADDDRDNNACNGLPGYNALKAALTAATNAEPSGLNMNMWGSL